MGRLCANVPKSLIPVGGRPFLARLVAHYGRLGFSPIVIAAGRLGEKITEEFNRPTWEPFDIGLTLSQSGTARAVAKSMALLGAPQDFVLMNGDTIVDLPVRSFLAAARTPRTRLLMALSQRPGVDDERHVAVGGDGRVVGFGAGAPAGGSVAWRGSHTGVVFVGRAAWPEVRARLDRTVGGSFESRVLEPLAARGWVRAFDCGRRFLYDYGTPAKLARLRRRHAGDLDRIFR